VEFLSHVGIDVAPAAVEAGVQSLDQKLRHHGAEEDEYSEFAAVQRGIYQHLIGMAGVHKAWKPPTFPPSPLWVDDVIAVRRDYEQTRRQVRQMTRSRVFKVSAALKKVTGGLTEKPER
jgi:hypothetical protein